MPSTRGMQRQEHSEHHQARAVSLRPTTCVCGGASPYCSNKENVVKTDWLYRVCHRVQSCAWKDVSSLAWFGADMRISCCCSWESAARRLALACAFETGSSSRAQIDALSLEQRNDSSMRGHLCFKRACELGVRKSLRFPWNSAYVCACVDGMRKSLRSPWNSA